MSSTDPTAKSPAQLALYATNSNRFSKAWTLARTLATSPVIWDSRLPDAPPSFRVTVLRLSHANPRIPSDHTWKLAVALARQLARVPSS